MTYDSNHRKHQERLILRRLVHQGAEGYILIPAENFAWPHVREIHQRQCGWKCRSDWKTEKRARRTLARRRGKIRCQAELNGDALSAERVNDRHRVGDLFLCMY